MEIGRHSVLDHPKVVLGLAQGRRHIRDGESLDVPEENYRLALRLEPQNRVTDRVPHGTSHDRFFGIANGSAGWFNSRRNFTGLAVLADREAMTDGWQLGEKGRRSATITDGLPRLEERLLGEVFGFSAITGLIITVSIDPFDMLIVQRREGRGIALDGSVHQFGFSSVPTIPHAAPPFTDAAA